jgi:hypothetical protein
MKNDWEGGQIGNISIIFRTDAAVCAAVVVV